MMTVANCIGSQFRYRLSIGIYCVLWLSNRWFSTQLWFVRRVILSVDRFKRNMIQSWILMY